MRRSLTVLLTLGILVLGAALLAAVENATVSGDGVRIREAPGTSGKIVGSVNKATRLEVTGRSPVTETIDGHLDSWYAVIFQGKPGYVFGRFLTLDAGAVVGAEGPPAPQLPTISGMTARPEDIIGDWANYGALPSVIYTFEPEGRAQYLTLQWNVDLDKKEHRVSRKYLIVDLVRGSYTIDGSTLRVAWFWGEIPESLFTIQKSKDGIVLVIDGAQIDAKFHTRESGATPIGDIVINTEPDL